MAGAMSHRIASGAGGGSREITGQLGMIHRVALHQLDHRSEERLERTPGGYRL